MTELLTAAAMRKIEQAAIRAGHVTGLELMERAGRGVVEAVFAERPELSRAPHRAVVLCGPGNNGGDGFVVARLLKEWGWEVALFLYGDAAKLPPDAKANCERWRGMGEIRPWDAAAVEAAQADLYVDAILGSGLTRPPGEEIMAPLAGLHRTGLSAGRLVAIDAPTGLCMDSGRPLAPGEGAARAFLTVTFHRMRPGHFLAEGPGYCGAVRLVDIGLGAKAGEGPPIRLAGPPDPGLLDKGGAAHKYDHGHALVLTGGAGRTGAARLAARGALRIGAGLVTLGVPGAARQEVAGQVTALMLRRVDDAAALARLLEDGRLNALCLGPGLGLERAREIVPAALEARRGAVLDADALTAYGEAPETLFGMLHEGCVLTPHDGEFARLFPDLAHRLSAAPANGPAWSRVDAARAAAARAGCTVLLKGADTVIAAPDGACTVSAARYARAAPWLATAGAGDVLAGFIAGLVARGMTSAEAAIAAAWLHADCARAFGPGLVAEDLPEALPGVLRRLLPGPRP